MQQTTSLSQLSVTWYDVPPATKISVFRKIKKKKLSHQAKHNLHSLSKAYASIELQHNGTCSIKLSVFLFVCTSMHIWAKSQFSFQTGYETSHSEWFEIASFVTNSSSSSMKLHLIKSYLKVCTKIMAHTHTQNRSFQNTDKNINL